MRKIQSSIFSRSLLWLVPVLILHSCSISRRIPEGERYFSNHKINVSDRPADYQISSDELLALSRAQPNRKIVWTRVNLRIHTWLVPPRALERSLIRSASRCPEKNARRLNRGKQPKECKSLWSWLAYTVGEPPALLDTSKVATAARQMEIYIQKKGFFSCEVEEDIRCTDSTTWFWKDRQKCEVIYQVKPGKPYHYRDIQYVIEDPGMDRRIEDLKEESLIQPGDRFDSDILDAERDRIAAFYNNSGYYTFTKDYIVYDADSTVGNRNVDIILRLKPASESTTDKEGESVIIPHRKYYIGDVYVHTQHNPLQPDDLSGETEMINGIHVVKKGKGILRPQLIGYTSSVGPGELYQKRKIDLTYKRFSQLGVTRSVTIQLNPRQVADSSGLYLLDAHILLNPARKQTFSFDPRVTNRSGNMGIYTNLIYRHRNLFKGAENFEIRIVSGFEASQVLGQSTTDGTTQQIERNFQLNTFEIGPDISLSIPRLFPLSYDRFKKSSEPRTTFHAALNYQVRPDYERNLAQFSFGYSFIENPDKVTRFNIELAEVSVIKIKKSPGFEAFINRLNDDFLANSYRDHLITASRIVFTLNTQKNRFQRYYFYYRTTVIEGAGNLLREIYEVTNQPRDEVGSYEISNIRFAQYVKTDHDLRAYFNANERNGFVIRAFGGVGVPLTNLSVLPFEKSFFVGGANGIRAWQARTLGPGSYRDTTSVRTFNNIGDVKLECNIEYRFKITQMFQAALFMDAGNIWRLRPDADRPGAEFSGSRFLSEVAIGAGFGVRLDFEFFLVRLDVGYPLKDPLKIPGERWAWQPKDEFNAFLSSLSDSSESLRYRTRGVFNVGIGFPF